MTADTANVLIVEDDDPNRETYDHILSTSYEVTAVGTGCEALDALSANTDVVLLDRQLPEMSGDEMLRELQARNYDCYVVMVTAVEPDFEIIEMGIDDYLVKPVTADMLVSTVERSLSLAEYNALFQELSQKRVKRNVLRTEKSKAKLRNNEEYDRLQTEIKQLEAELDDMASELDGIKNEAKQ